MDYPEHSADTFYNQFSDPQRAYWNIAALYEMYKNNPAIPYPDSELDHVNHAWKDAHKINKI